MKPADGCEANLAFDPKNCGACGNVCPMNMPGCNMGVCAMGCLNGMLPPPVCTAGVDPETQSKYVLCQADCNQAWISANTGGNYHAQQICQLYGYSTLGRYGGTCGNVCGYCQAQTSCMATGNQNFDGGGTCGQDQFGPIICFTVMWQCLR